MTILDTRPAETLLVDDAPLLPAVCDIPPRAVKTFPRTPGAVADVRRWLGKILTAWSLDDEVVYTAQLLASELVTNTVIHVTETSEPTTVSAVLWRDMIRITVTDPGTDRCTPTACHADPDDEHGRGLAIIDALADDYGTDHDSAGKRCWFILTAGGAS